MAFVTLYLLDVFHDLDRWFLRVSTRRHKKSNVGIYCDIRLRIYPNGGQMQSLGSKLLRIATLLVKGILNVFIIMRVWH